MLADQPEHANVLVETVVFRNLTRNPYVCVLITVIPYYGTYGIQYVRCTSSRHLVDVVYIICTTYVTKYMVELELFYSNRMFYNYRMFCYNKTLLIELF